MKENIEELQNKKYLKDINEAIKVYEEFRRLKNDDFIESIDPDFFFNLTDIILSDYKRVLKENEELKYKYDKALSDVIAGVDLDNTYIPVQKIQDKIEELKNKSGGNVFHIQQTINAEIRLLQDLLEEKGE